jgi:uncharacterized membrane protein YjgN (DUF898 family)
MDAQLATSSHVSARGRFLGESRDYWRLLARDALQLVATLGLYRFWVATDVRRYLWSRTEIAGEQLDYDGDPLELLKGFLVFLVVLAPVTAVLSLFSLRSGNLYVAALLEYPLTFLLVPLAVLALYQARRYRVNHTVFRGLRFHQTGSAWIYALRTALWFLLNVLTLGATYPWARASLDRYKMRHTFYGDVQGYFEGTGWQLFKRIAPFWLLVAALLTVWSLEVAATANGDPAAAKSLQGATWWLWRALLLAVLLLYPIFHAIVLRWRIAGMRFGTLSFASDFSTWRFYKAYLKFYALMVLLATIVWGVSFVVQLKIVPVILAWRSVVVESIGVVLLVIAYFAVATAVAFAYQGTVRFATWRLIADSLAVRGLDQLDRAKVHAGHAARHTGRIGAALNLGGF